jgi:hypothetical protein
LAASWNSLGSGNYKQTITLPSALEYDDVTLTFRDASGYVVYPTVVKVATTQYDVFVNDNTLELTVLIN